MGLKSYLRNCFEKKHYFDLKYNFRRTNIHAVIKKVENVAQWINSPTCNRENRSSRIRKHYVARNQAEQSLLSCFHFCFKLKLYQWQRRLWVITDFKTVYGDFAACSILFFSGGLQFVLIIF